MLQEGGRLYNFFFVIIGIFFHLMKEIDQDSGVDGRARAYKNVHRTEDAT